MAYLGMMHMAGITNLQLFNRFVYQQARSYKMLCQLDLEKDECGAWTAANVE